MTKARNQGQKILESYKPRRRNKWKESIRQENCVKFLTSINLQKIYQDIEIQTIRKHAWYFVPKIVETLLALRFSIVNGTFANSSWKNLSVPFLSSNQKRLNWHFDKLKHLPSKGRNKSESTSVRIECMTFSSCWNVPRSKCRLW